MTVHLTRRYPTEREAREVVAALAADQPDYVRSSVDGSTMSIEIRGPTASSARATADDLLACVIAAERTLGLLPKRS